MTPAFTAFWERYKERHVFPDRRAMTHARLAALGAWTAARRYNSALNGRANCEHAFTKEGSECWKCGALG